MTLLIAIALVVLVIFLFLQDWRTTLIPAMTIPVSLLGTFFLMKVLGFSINTLTLFGLTLATGLVVDDAIVVIENIARFIQEKGMPPLEGAREAMREITGAVLASSLVLLAVFVPVAFFPGTTGQLYKQFALTIACSITISLFSALTLTPVLSSLLLGHVQRKDARFLPPGQPGDRRDARRLSPCAAGRDARGAWLALGVFAVLLGLTGWVYIAARRPAFIPDEDQGYFDRHRARARRRVARLHARGSAQARGDLCAQQPEIADIFDVGGFSFTGNGSNKATMFIRLKPWAERHGAEHSARARSSRRVNGAAVLWASIRRRRRSRSTRRRFRASDSRAASHFELEDRANAGIPALHRRCDQVIGQPTRRTAPLADVYTHVPHRQADAARRRRPREGASASASPSPTLFNTMQVYLGSVYVNDFDLNGKSYRVYVQADTPYRSRVSDLQRIYVRSATPLIVNGQQVAPPAIPLIGAGERQTATAPPFITHYNLYRSIEINGAPAPGHGSGEALAADGDGTPRTLPPGFAYEWSGISLEQIEGGAQAALIFGLGIVFVFLVLAAQYESFADPLIILLAVPLARARRAHRPRVAALRSPTCSRRSAT